MPRPKKDWWVEERAARERGFRIIAGIDEAGRGPLAGPVVAACVVLPFEADLSGVRDSKTMTHEQRERACDLIRERAQAIGIGVVEASEIDTLNILRATHKAMRCALDALPSRPDVALIDGLPVYPFPIPQVALVKGDGRSASVAAASILAKVTRDRVLTEYDALYPQYRFSVHKGYPTPEHLALLEQHGPCPIHRRSFAPVARLLRAGDSLPLQPSLFLENAGRREVGGSGELIATAHLERIGWEILATRFRCREGEIDIVGRDGAALVFVEVKTRRGKCAVPGEAVGARKRARLLAAAEAYLATYGITEQTCRFDVVEVLFTPDGYAKVNHLRNAFLAGE
jgi:ribonuclease HII